MVNAVWWISKKSQNHRALVFATSVYLRGTFMIYLLSRSLLWCCSEWLPKSDGTYSHWLIGWFCCFVILCFWIFVLQWVIDRAVRTEGRGACWYCCDRWRCHCHSSDRFVILVPLACTASNSCGISRNWCFHITVWLFCDPDTWCSSTTVMFN